MHTAAMPATMALANVEWTKYGMAKSKPAKSGLNIMFGE